MLETIYMLKFASKLENIREVDYILDEIRQRVNPSPRTFHCIQLSLTEAVNNAIVHGNREDASKYVSLKMSQTKNSITITVKDEGIGFNINNIPSPLSAENIECCGGRGVFLIRQLCDQVKYVKNGSIVKLTFYIR